LLLKKNSRLIFTLSRQFSLEQSGSYSCNEFVADTDRPGHLAGSGWIVLDAEAWSEPDHPENRPGGQTSGMAVIRPKRWFGLNGISIISSLHGGV
jgi:hypothetical protein